MIKNENSSVHFLINVSVTIWNTAVQAENGDTYTLP